MEGVAHDALHCVLPYRFDQSIALGVVLEHIDRIV